MARETLNDRVGRKTKAPDTRRSEGVAFPPLPAALAQQPRSAPGRPAAVQACACCGFSLLTSFLGGFCPRCGYLTDPVEGA